MAKHFLWFCCVRKAFLWVCCVGKYFCCVGEAFLWVCCVSIYFLQLYINLLQALSSQIDLSNIDHSFHCLIFYNMFRIPVSVQHQHQVLQDYDVLLKCHFCYESIPIENMIPCLSSIKSHYYCLSCYVHEANMGKRCFCTALMVRNLQLICERSTQHENRFLCLFDHGKIQWTRIENDSLMDQDEKKNLSRLSFF